MSNQINELLDAYWDAAYQEGKEGRTHDTPDGKAQAIRTALEAALKPGAPVAWRLWDDEPGGVPAWRYYDQSDFRIGVNPHDFFHSLVPLYTATPAQTKRLDSDESRLTPPPRLTDTAVEACVKAVEDAFAWTGGHGEPSKPGPDAIANIIRSHFHVATDPAVNGGFELKPVQTPPLTYYSTQATTCACCGKHKHTPLRIDKMGGYVCLTCIDRKLGSLLGEFGRVPVIPICKEHESN